MCIDTTLCKTTPHNTCANVNIYWWERTKPNGKEHREQQTRERGGVRRLHGERSFDVQSMGRFEQRQREVPHNDAHVLNEVRIVEPLRADQRMREHAQSVHARLKLVLAHCLA